MQQLMEQLKGYAGGSMSNPNGMIQPMKTAALDGLNQSFIDAPRAATQQLAARGFGSSGDMGSSLFRVALAKAGSQSQLDQNFSKMALDQGNFGASLSRDLLNSMKGSHSTTTGPPMGAANGLASAGGDLNNISMIMMLNKMLKGGGGGGVTGDVPGGLQQGIPSGMMPSP